MCTSQQKKETMLPSRRAHMGKQNQKRGQSVSKGPTAVIQKVSLPYSFTTIKVGD